MAPAGQQAKQKAPSPSFDCLLQLFVVFGEQSTSTPSLPSHLGAYRAQNRGNRTPVSLHSAPIRSFPVKALHGHELLLGVTDRIPTRSTGSSLYQVTQNHRMITYTCNNITCNIITCNNIICNIFSYLTI